MGRRAGYIRKRRTKWLPLALTLLWLVMNSGQSDAQRCADTVHIKGYYVVKLLRSELVNPRITKKDSRTTVAKFNVDVNREESFIPQDSITDKRTLAYRLNHFYDVTRQVFISCERLSVRDIDDKDCLDSTLTANKDTCLFPFLPSNVLYETTNKNSGDVFEIYYMDAYWAKIKVKKGSVKADLIPGRIAQMCISPNVSEFDLYCFIRCDNLRLAPPIKAQNIRIWKQ